MAVFASGILQRFSHCFGQSMRKGCKNISNIQLCCCSLRRHSAECMASVVGRNQTVLHERPSGVAPHAPPIQADVRASGGRSLDSDQQQKRLNFIRNCANSIFASPSQKELETTFLQYQEKGAEVDAHTAELYSKQGNTYINELVIDETTQC